MYMFWGHLVAHPKGRVAEMSTYSIGAAARCRVCSKINGLRCRRDGDFWLSISKIKKMGCIPEAFPIGNNISMAPIALNDALALVNPMPERDFFISPETNALHGSLEIGHFEPLRSGALTPPPPPPPPPPPLTNTWRVIPGSGI